MHRYPDGHVIYRKLTKNYPLVVRGEGCYLYDETGKRYLDACGGAFVANLGHGLSEIADAMAAQARRASYLTGMVFTTDAVEALATELARLSPGDLDHVYFLTSGSEAVEAALKMARQYWVEMGRGTKHKIIALSPGYHGNTLLAMSASARGHYKRFFQPWLVDVHFIPAPYAYRCDCRGAEPPCSACSGDALEQAILEEGADSVAAFIAEPIGGSSTGASVPRPEWYRRVREVCDRHGVLFIADEVLTGAGRTGTWSVMESTGIVPDLMTMGKGIGGGYAPLSAVIAPRRIVNVLARGSGSLAHAQTFSHHPVLCAGGLAALHYLREHRLVQRSATMGLVLHEHLASLADLPHVGDVRGRGLLAGVEFVADKATRAPFPREAHFAEHFTEAAQSFGLMVWPNIGQADGTNGDLIMIAPPFVIAEEQIKEIVTLFRVTLQAVVASQ
jgi:adenosylmethionine-8-amino-7-oxononanoate aminotransferase